VTRFLIAALLGVAVCASIQPAHSQQTFLDRFRDHNPTMANLQPAWIAPLIQSDSRLLQGMRFSVSRAGVPGAEPISYGNNHGISLIEGTRFQFDFNPPSFFRNHCAARPDGWGNALAQVKYRIASGNAEHGNFEIAAMWEHGFAPGAQQTYMFTGYDLPKLAAGKAFGRFDVQSAVDGLLPTGKIDQQGRALDWNMAGQFHATSRTWFDIENNATFNLGGPYDGKTQNFITPAAFFVVRKKDWGPRHPAAVFDGGMQIATSHFCFYNHNLITEMRIMF
jgi:hypothetical protein